MSNSPWGKIQSQVKLARGVRWVDTTSHGGFLVSKRFANLYLSQAAVKRGKSWGNYLAYEEDCDAAIVLYETKAFHDQLGLTTNGDVDRHASLSYWHADYLIERGIEPTPEGLVHFNTRKQYDQLRAAKSPDLIVAAGHPTSKESSSPNEDVIVWTADGKRWLVLASEYTVKTINLLSEHSNPREVRA